MITKPYSFGSGCIGCHKPLHKWNKHIYHNKKCFAKWNKFLDDLAKRTTATDSNANIDWKETAIGVYLTKTSMRDKK